MSYLSFPLVSSTDKTQVYNVVGSGYLGKVKWYANWRRYVFFPNAETLFDVSCLNEITGFINGLMEARKKK